MILMFGPAGSGKSLQGQILAARHSWTWISVGKVLRQRAESDQETQARLNRGELLPVEETNRIVAERLDEESDLSHIILDGYPRSMEQATALVDYLQRRGNGAIDIVIVLDVGRDEIMRRLRLRGRADDTEAAIAKRLDIFADKGEAILDYLIDNNIRVERLIGSRTVGQVHDQIEELVQGL